MTSRAKDEVTPRTRARRRLAETIGQAALERYERALETLEPMERELVVARLEQGLDPGASDGSVGGSVGGEDVDALARALARLSERMAKARSG